MAHTDQERKRRFMQRRREWLDSLKAKPCADCGGEFPPYCMDWHHEGDKNHSRGYAFAGEWSRVRILKEIAKCVLLCAICHRKRHHA